MCFATQSILFKFSIPYRAWRYAETRILSIVRMKFVQKPTDVDVPVSVSFDYPSSRERRKAKVRNWDTEDDGRLSGIRCVEVWTKVQNAMCRATEHWTEHRDMGETGESRYFQTIFTETIGLCGPYDEILGTRRHQRYFGCLNSCQEVVLHVSHLMDLLDSSRRRGVVWQLTRNRALFLLLSLRQRLC